MAQLDITAMPRIRPLRVAVLLLGAGVLALLVPLASHGWLFFTVILMAACLIGPMAFAWQRNRFAGIDNRYVGAAGVGNIWWDREDLKFRSDYGLSYTQQTDVVEVPGRDPSFFGIRGSWDYLNRWGKNVDYVNEFDLYLNMETSKDWRASMLNSVAVTMTDNLALKVSLLWLYQNDPAYTLTSPPEVPVQLENLDTIFTTSLVINF